MCVRVRWLGLFGVKLWHIKLIKHQKKALDHFLAALHF